MKKNDFLLSQNELRISTKLIVDLIERKNFNRESLVNPDVDDPKEALERFRLYCDQGYNFQIQYDAEKDEWPYEERKVHWHLKPEPIEDEDEFYEQIWRRL